MTTTIRVQLPEGPTAVLVWLVKTRPSGRSREEIAAAMTQLHPELVADEALRGTARALGLLHSLRLVHTRGSEICGLEWYATAEGVEAVREAEPVGSSPALPAKSKEME